MKDLTLKELKQIFGIPFIAIIVCAAVFALPKLIYYNFLEYKEIAQQFNKE